VELNVITPRETPNNWLLQTALYTLYSRQRSTKLATTATGIDVTGTVTADNAEIGTLGASDANAIIDLTGDTTYTDFGFRIIRNSGANGRTDLRHRGTGDFVIEAVEAAEIAFETSDTERMRIDSSGNVGIGTASVAYKLDVNGSLSSNGSENVMRIAAADSTQAGGVNIHSIYGASASSRVTTFFSIDGQGQASPLAFGNGTTEAMRIDSSGNVGIGETSPSTFGKLVVTGSTPFAVLRSSDVTTAGFSMLVNGGSNGVGSIATDDGGHLTFDTGSTGAGQAERMRLDASGNLGLGVVPSAWQWPAFQTQRASISGGVSGDRMDLSLNYFRNGGASQDQYIGTGFATNYRQITGQHQWFTAPSGTAGNAISFTQAMTLDASGNVGIGLSSPTDYGATVNTLEVKGASASGSGLVKVTGADGVVSGALYAGGSTSMVLSTQTNHALSFATNNTEHMTLDASGNLLVGTTNEETYNFTSGGGTALWGNGLVSAAKSGAIVGIFNRTSSDGDILQFRKDGATVGSIGTVSGLLGIGSGDAILAFDGTGNAMLPMSSQTGGASDGVLDFGSSLRRFKDLYLSGGVVFGATGGSVSSKTLDDYEEGTFTPVVSGSTTAGAGTYTAINGAYTKIGNTVYFQIDYILSAHTGTGDTLITGLPFTSGTTYYTNIVSSAQNLALTASYYIGGSIIAAGDTKIYFQQTPVGGGSAIGIPIDPVCDVRLSGFYFV
jgi:hypothetical protein